MAHQSWLLRKRISRLPFVEPQAGHPKPSPLSLEHSEFDGVGLLPSTIWRVFLCKCKGPEWEGGGW